MLLVSFSLLASATVFVANASPLAKRSGSTTCAIIGFDKSPAYFHSTDTSISNFSGCMAACSADSNCVSFSVGYSSPQCNLYNLPLRTNVNPMDVYNDFVFYDKGCTVEYVSQVGSPEIPLPAQLCGVNGFDLDTHAYHVAYSPYDTWPGCHGLCLADPNCHSFAVGGGQCYMYFVGALENTNQVPSSFYTFYDRNCPAPAVTSSAPPPSSTSVAIVQATPPPYTPENTLVTSTA